MLSLRKKLLVAVVTMSFLLNIWVGIGLYQSTQSNAILLDALDKSLVLIFKQRILLKRCGTLRDIPLPRIREPTTKEDAIEI